MDVYTDVDPQKELIRLDAVAAREELEHWLVTEGLMGGNLEQIALRWERAIVEGVLVAQTAGLPLPEYISRCFER